MVMGVTNQSKIVRRSQLRRYDMTMIYLPKGRIQDVKDFAANRGQSVNGLINDLLRNALGVAEEDWQERKEA